MGQSLEHQLQGHCGVRPWSVSQKTALSGGKCREPTHPGTHPPSPHTCSAQPSLEHVVAQLRASRAGSRDPLPRPGRAPVAPGYPTRKKRRSLEQSSRLPEPVSSQPSTATRTEFCWNPTNPRPRQLPTTPTFLCHLANRQDTKKKKIIIIKGKERRGPHTPSLLAVSTSSLELGEEMEAHLPSAHPNSVTRGSREQGATKRPKGRGEVGRSRKQSERGEKYPTKPR